MSINGQALDRKMVRQSNIKVIKCGNIIELYEYEQVYYYNMGKIGTDHGDSEEDTSPTMRGDNLARTQRKIKRLINSNTFVYGHRPKFVTYTFADNITDIKEANRHFNNNRRKLSRLVGRKLRYLAVPELQKRGAIHYHVVYFDLPYIKNIKAKFREAWGEGHVQVKTITHVRNTGAYISKYFSKQWASERVTGTKGFFTASNLFQPEVFRSIDILSKFDNLIPEYTESNVSAKFGTVKYTQFKITTSNLNSKLNSKIKSYDRTSYNPQSKVTTLQR